MMSFDPLSNLDLPLYYPNQHRVAVGNEVDGMVYVRREHTLYGSLKDGTAYYAVAFKWPGQPLHYFKVSPEQYHQLNLLESKYGFGTRFFKEDALKNLGINFSVGNIYNKNRSPVIGTFTKGKPIYLPSPIYVAKPPSPTYYKGKLLSPKMQQSHQAKRVARAQQVAKQQHASIAQTRWGGGSGRNTANPTPPPALSSPSPASTPSSSRSPKPSSSSGSRRRSSYTR